MDLPPVILQFAGSLVAIFALAGLAYWLKLGARPKLLDDAGAKLAADQAVSGFEPITTALDKNGHGAILRDEAGQILILRPHGSHFAGRLLTNMASMKTSNNGLLVDSGEARFGVTHLAVSDPEAWVNAWDTLKSASDA